MQAEVKEKRAYHHGDLRAQLVEATRQLVEEFGPDHFSVSEACRRAGVSTAAPYKHFKDKGEMLLAVTSEGMQRKMGQMLSALEPLPEGDLARITALGRVYVNFALEEPGVFRLMFGLSGDHGDNEDLQAQGQKTFDVVKQEVANYLGESEFTEDVNNRAFLLWSFVHGLSFLIIDGKLSKMGGSVDLDAMLQDIARRVMA